MQEASSQSRDLEIRSLIEALQPHGKLAPVPDVVRYLSDELDRQAVTDERLAELFRRTELAQTQARESREQDRAKDRFLAMLSHELRTPLQPVLSAASTLLRDGRLPADLLEHVRTIQRNVQLEARLIDDMLDLTKVAAGKFSLEKLAVNMESVIARSVEICQAEATAKSLKIERLLHARRPWVSADPGRLQQILWNLIKNAVKFTPANGNITIQTSDGADGRIVVEVIDNGIGIHPQVLPRIFNAFEQGDKEITQRFGGLGLGLAISKVLADGHNGTLEAHSAGEGSGATFRLTLPTIDAPKRPSETGKPGYNAMPSPMLNILLVDDDADTCHVMGRLLETLKHTVTPAGSCQAARAAAAKQKFDLLLCDLRLPDGSGLELVGPLKSTIPTMKAIALTGYGSPEDIQKSLDAGFDQHLTKPVTLDLLVQTINRLFV